ncbi:MAG: response regulator, partial [Acidobacteriota bacterium]
GEVVGARVVLRDVSQVKELEQQLQQSQKLEVIGSLAGGVAHDFNNVLGGILGYASLLRSQLRDQPLVAKYVKTIERSAVRGSELAGKLLAASRRTGLPIEPIDFNQIVEETLELLARTLHKSIRIEKSLDRRLGLLLGERSQMQQVVLNLCVNARDAMQSGGVLRLETEYLEQEGKLRFSVKDTGTGMTADTMKRIFEPFFTTRGPSGTGLGLSVVYGIVKSNDGDIRVQSSPGQGSRFDVFLPASWTEEEAYVFEPHDPVRGHGELILLVDDEEVLRDLGRDILESFGYRVETARSGEQGIDVFRRRRDEIALVLLDLVMPGLDGAETCRRLRSLAPDVPVLILSGLSQEGTVDQLLQEGAQGFVPKPYAIGDLTRAVSDALRGGEPPSVVH